jgi:hypothetical protein
MFVFFFLIFSRNKNLNSKKKIDLIILKKITLFVSCFIFLKKMINIIFVI